LAIFGLPARAEETITSQETVIRLTVRPMAAPKPALRYLLLPELKEMNPGNPIPNYLKCNLDQGASSDRTVISRAALRQADRAARLDKPDWQILLQAKTDGIRLLVPDVQKMRELAAALQERFHQENAQGRFDDSIRTAKTMFAMSRHMSEHPTLIGDLVGIAIAFIAIGPLEEMLEKPGCPNLYWALTNLPNPLVPLDRGLEGERMLMEVEFRDLNDRVPMSGEQIQKLIVHMDKLRALGGKLAKGTREWLDARNKDAKALDAARARLVEAGLSKKRLWGFPADQVLLLDQKLAYEVRRDEAMNLMKLPAWQFEKLVGQLRQPKDPGLFGFLLASFKIPRAQARLDQRVALLRHVEALRLYAAAHAGKLPAQLSDCGVPLPADPFTGKPFRYKADGATAHLYGSPPAGDAKNPAYNVHFEVTIQK
jgi:hypothetical protein